MNIVGTFDVVVVGARCAGAALGTHLAAGGVRVAVLDAARLPSDQPASTHLIQPPGMDELDRLDIGDQVRKLAPALRNVRLEFDGQSSYFSYGTGRAAYCLPRTELDRLLQDRAEAAGAELRPQSRVFGVVRDPDGRVRGVDVRRSSGAPERVLADLVVGADGRHSTLAGLVGASEYWGYDGPRSCYWAYWHTPPGWDPHVAYNSFRGDEGRIVFPTTDDRILIATTPEISLARQWRGNHRDAYISDIRSSPFGSAVAETEPLGEVRAVFRNRYFFREAVGPGWALIGDAGHHKDFVSGLGISDALRDAHSLAGAYLDGRPSGLQRYWRQRDVERIELFQWSRDLGAADVVTGLERLVGARAGTKPEISTRLGSVLDGRLSPYQLVPPLEAVRWVAAELAHGRRAPVSALMATAARAVRSALRLRRCRRFLSKVSRSQVEKRPRFVDSCAEQKR